jgi:hypothetical protein
VFTLNSRRWRSIGIKIFAFSILVWISAAVLYAQDPRGTIVGRVTDKSGAVVPNLEVRATNQETSVAATGRTTSAGDYRIGFLLPGKYTVSAEAAGFKKYVRQNIEVRVTETIEVSFAMDLGAVSEIVDVVAESPVLSTADASQGTVIESLAVQELPLAGGNPVELALLDPATMNETDMREHRAEMTNADSQWSSMGGGAFNNEFQIDGVSNTFADGAGHARVAFNPPSSAIGQFKIVTNPFDASAGNTLGATVNVSTKSGTNKFHGEGHYYGRNNFFDCMDFFSNKNKTPQTVYQDNRYGASLGGPIRLPRLYNGKGRTFFFYAWEENRYNLPQSWTGTVPTAAERNGDFSALLAIKPATGSAKDFQIYDPYTTVGNNGTYSRQLFPGNIVPKSRFDSAGFALANLYPLPTQPGDYDGERNYFSSTRSDELHWVHILRVDHSFSESHRVFVRADYDYWDEVKNKYMTGIQGLNLNRINRGLALDDVILLNPNLVMHIRYGFTEQDFPEKRISRGADLKALGFSSTLVNLIDPTRVTLPRVTPTTFSQYANWESGDGANTALTHDINADLTTQRGRHSLRFGTGYRAYRAFGNRYQYETAPDLTFGMTYANSTNTAAAPPLGPDLASMLMGIATAGTMQHQASSALQNQFLSGYVQDDFKLRSNLTINIGMRYELEFPMTERYDRMVTGFAFNQVNPIEAAARAAYTSPIPELPNSQLKLMGGLQFAGQGANGRAIYPVHAHNFLPRIGGAWQVSRRVTIRSGYGIYFGSLGVNSTIVQQSGFTASTPLQATVDNGISYRALVSNPYPTGLLPVTGAAGGLSTFLGQAFTFYDPNKSLPYSQRWTFAVQSLLPSQILMEASYVGNRSTHINTSRSINSTPLQYLSPLMTRDSTVINYLGSTVPNPLYNLGPVFTSSTITRGNLLLPYPEFGAITMNDSQGFAWYHSLQVRGTRRMGHGVTVNMGYAFSKSMEAVAYLNSADTRPYRTLSASDRPHRVTGSVVWQLPIGRRRAYFSNMNKVLEGVFGNWQMSAVVIRQAGGPLTWGNVIFAGDPDQIALPKDQRSVDHWFNTADFNKVSSQQLASNIRYFPMRLSSVRADGQAKWDVSMAKTFRIREGVEFRLRTQCFNIMNHPNFAGPNLTTTSAQFGTITSTVGMPRTFQAATTLQF